MCHLYLVDISESLHHIVFLGLYQLVGNFSFQYQLKESPNYVHQNESYRIQRYNQIRKETQQTMCPIVQLGMI